MELQAKDGTEARDALDQLVEDGDSEGAQAALDQLPVGETAHFVSRLDQADQEQLLATLAPPDAADLVERLSDAQAADIVERLEPERAAAILRELPSDEQADLLAALDEDDAEEILAKLGPVEAQGIRQLASYPGDAAGGLMATEFLTFADTATVGEVVEELRKKADEFEDEETQYVYLVSAAGALVGVLRLRDLLFTRGRRIVSEIMISDPLTVRVDASLDVLADHFERHAFLGLPVVDEREGLLGVIQRANVEEALWGRSQTAFMKAKGIVCGEELRTMPVWSRSATRLAWLIPNIVLNLIAACVIGLYQDTIEAVVALALFLPIISDMSGCSGNQAVAVSIRELTLGLVKPRELLYVWAKEIRVGMINGVALGTLIAAIAWAWKGNAYLGLVVGAAMVLNTMVAVSIGGAVPLVLKRLGADPALASGPILTTVTDACGFFLVLSFATALLPHLAGV
ncbi:MAG: magnesium transporter [Planctomycetota bacterium]|jgi:magnesium transporter